VVVVEQYANGALHLMMVQFRTIILIASAIV
jgi:hypothetical protein